MKLIRCPQIIAAGVTAVVLGAWPLPAQTPSAGKATAPAAPAAPAAASTKSPGGHGLTPEQRAKLDELRRTQREKLQAIRADESLTPEEKRAKARDSLAAARAEMGAVFSPEQRERLQQRREHLRQRMRHAARARLHHRLAGWHEQRAGWGRPHGWGPGRHFAPRGHGFAPGFHHRGPMGPGLRGPAPFGHRGGPGGPPRWGSAPGVGAGPFGDLGLTAEQKAKFAELQKRQRAQMSENMKAFQQEFRALLTPEQQQKLDARRGPRPPEKKP